MRGPSKIPPKYRKHKPTGQAIVTLNAKDHYLGPFGTKASRMEYDRLIGEWLANGRSMPVSDRSIAVTELIARYWKFATGYYVKNGKLTDEQPDRGWSEGPSHPCQESSARRKSILFRSSQWPSVRTVALRAND